VSKTRAEAIIVAGATIEVGLSGAADDGSSAPSCRVVRHKTSTSSASSSIPTATRLASGAAMTKSLDHVIRRSPDLDYWDGERP